MTAISALVLILAGALGASSWLIKQQPDAAQMLGRLSPYQAGIGVVALIVGVLLLLQALINLTLVAAAPVSWLLLALSGLSGAALGLLLGWPLLWQHVFSRSPEARGHAEALRLRILAYQVPAGLTALTSGTLTLLNTIFIG